MKSLFSKKTIYWLIPLVFLYTGCQQISLNLGAYRSSEDLSQDETEYGCAYFYFLWGCQAETDQRYEEALEAFEKALICDPQAEYITRKMPILLLHLNRVEEALTWLTGYIKKHPEAIGSRLLLAKVYIRLARYDDAAKEYRQISELHPDDRTSLLLLGEMYMNLKQYDEAIIPLKKVASGKDYSYTAKVMLARVYRAKEEFETALSYYNEALENNWSVELLFEIGEMYIGQKKYDKAIATYNKILEEDEYNENARFALVQTYLILNEQEKALNELSRLKETSEEPGQVDLIIAKIYARQNQPDKAISILQDVLKQEELSEARYLLAILYFQADKLNLALSQLELVPEDAKEYKDAIFFQARILSLNNKVDEAIEILKNAVSKKEGRSAEMFIWLAALYQQKQQIDLSQKTFSQALSFYPEDISLLYEYGLFLDNSKRIDEAMTIMQKVIKLKPDHAAALNYVGYTWTDKNIHLDKALGYITKAVSMKPDNGYIRDSLGWIYFRLGRYEEAVKELLLSLELVPDDPAILNHLGDVYVVQDQVEKAIQAYDKAIKFFKSEEEKEKVRIKIDNLKKREQTK